MKTFLTGSKGFLGSDIQNSIAECIDLAYSRNTKILYPQIEQISLDQNFQIIHCGASSSRHSIGNQIYLNNYYATKQLVDAVAKDKSNRLIFMSANSILERNNISMCKDLYSHLKLESEHYIKEKLSVSQYAIIRLPGLYKRGHLGAGLIDKIMGATFNGELRHFELYAKKKFNNMALTKDIVNFVKIIIQKKELPGAIGSIGTIDSISLSELRNRLIDLQPSLSRFITLNQTDMIEQEVNNTQKAFQLGYSSYGIIELIEFLYGKHTNSRT